MSILARAALSTIFHMLLDYSEPCSRRLCVVAGALSQDSTSWGLGWMHPRDPRALNHFTGTKTG
jgi:hypothetical protein